VTSWLVHQSLHPATLVFAYPPVHRVCLASLVQPMLGHRVCGLSVCHLEQGRGAFSKVCSGVAVAYLLQCSPLLIIQFKS
jgi:hypothetical protein